MSVKKYASIALLAITVAYTANGFYHILEFRECRDEYDKTSNVLYENKRHLRRWSRLKTPEQKQVNKQIKLEIERLEDICKELKEKQDIAHGRIFNPFYGRF